MVIVHGKHGLSDVTNKYCIVHRQMKNLYVRKKIDHCSSVFTGISQPEGPPFQWEKKLAEFPTGMVGLRVGIFLSTLPMMDSIYLTYPVPTRQKDKLKHQHAERQMTSLICASDVIMVYRILAYLGTSGRRYLNISNVVFNVEQEKESIICVRRWNRKIHPS